MNMSMTVRNPAFPEVKGNFGFGCMRLPMKDGEVDMEAFSGMVDAFIRQGFNYFDTAHGYIGGKSETAIKACLTSRYPREAYILTDKLSENFFDKAEDIRPYFETMCQATGVTYFDFFLLHAQNARNYEKYKACRAYEIAGELKAEGRVRHVGFSFHDSAEVLDRILTEQPQMEFVQIQFNYLDYEDEHVQSRACYEVCRKHGKPVIVMEPVRGGSLVNLPPQAMDVMIQAGGGSPASYAIRYAAGFEGIFMVLSGMSNMTQMQDNLSYMKDFHPLTEAEQSMVAEVIRRFRETPLIPCTGCQYCTDGCPMHIHIPTLFTAENQARQFGKEQGLRPYRRAIGIRDGNQQGKPSDCVQCGQCEEICPQHLPIRELLKAVAQRFEG
jgi:hypothetical protein